MMDLEKIKRKLKTLWCNIIHGDTGVKNHPTKPHIFVCKRCGAEHSIWTQP